MRRLLASSLETATFAGKQWKDNGSGVGSSEGDFIDWLTISDRVASVVADVWRIRHHSLVPGNIAIYGLIYDVRTGKLEEVNEAMTVGAPMRRAWLKAA